jgi:biopolymer transport protein ExbD
MMRRIAIIVAAALLCGCEDNERKPIPVIEVVILDQAGTYRIDGRTLYESALRDELQAIADKYRRPATGNCRAYVRVSHGRTVGFDRVQHVMDLCQGVGLDKVTEQVRESGGSAR